MATRVRHNSALLGSIGNREPSCAYSMSTKLQETAMMMNDLRETPTPPVDGGSTPKIVAALVVALGFGAMGLYTYEAGTWSSAPKYAAASKPVAASESGAGAAPSDAPLPSTTDLPPAPLKSADLPPAPVKNVAAQTSPPAATTPPV